MRSLLDASVLIAFFDSKHTLNNRAHDWTAANIKDGWASCPLTENAFVRIMSNPGYSRSRRFSVDDLMGLLSEFIQKTDHEFWADDISILDDSLFVAGRIHGPRQITDLYLLAMAAKHNGRLVTFDQSIPLSAVHGAKSANLVTL